MSDSIKRVPTSKPQALSGPDKLIAAVPKEAFKAMFYLFAGRPDSKTKLFNRKIQVTPEDVYHLNEKITEKFRLHQIEQTVTSATLKLKTQGSIQFGLWAEFENFEWRTSEVTEELSLRWDFVIKLDDYAAAQRHTLTVKITTAPSPRDVFQMMFSHDPDDDDIEGKFRICLARVDFISHRLADELIAVVSDWNKALKQPESACGWFCNLEKADRWIARGIHYTLPVLMTILALSILQTETPDPTSALTAGEFRYGLQCLLVSGLVLYAMIRLSRHIATVCYAAINNYGAFTPFNLTRGDENEATRLQKQDKKQILYFFLSSGFALLLNIVAGVITWHLLKG